MLFQTAWRGVFIYITLLYLYITLLYLYVYVHPCHFNKAISIKYIDTQARFRD